VPLFNSQSTFTIFSGSVYEESKKSVMIQPDGYQSPYTTLSYANGPGMNVLSEEVLKFFLVNIFRPSKNHPPLAPLDQCFSAFFGSQKSL
jgi:hypothetical protein